MIWKKITGYPLIFCSIVQILAGCYNLLWPSDGCNAFLYHMNYIVWALIMLSLLDNLIDNFLLFSFYGCFFIFLMGQKIFMPRHDEFLTFVLTTLDTEQYAVFLMILAIGIVTPYYTARYFLTRAHKKQEAADRLMPEKEPYTVSPFFMQALWLCFFMTLPFAFYMELKVAIVRSSYLYTDGYMVNVDIPSIVKIMNYLFLAFTMLLLAVHPPKKQAFFVLAVYFILQGGVQLIQGRRAMFAVSFLFLIWYLIKYFRIEHLKAGYVVTMLAAGLCIVGLFWVVGITRSNGDISQASPLHFIQDFMISTGGSDSLIANTIVQKDNLPGMGISYMLDPVVNNPLTVILTGKGGIIQGEHYIQAFHSLSHWISYLTNDVLYSSGYGMGSSYLAEAYVALGLAGVFICSVILGKCIAVLSGLHFGQNIFVLALSFILVRYLFVVPRSDFLGWFGEFTYFVIGAVPFWLIAHTSIKNENSI